MLIVLFEYVFNYVSAQAIDRELYSFIKIEGHPPHPSHEHTMEHIFIALHHLGPGAHHYSARLVRQSHRA